MRNISKSTVSATASESVYNESITTLFISGLTGAEVAPIQISSDNVNFANYYEGGSLVQLSAGAASKSLAYPGYYRVSIPNTSATASVSAVKPEWANIIDRQVTTVEPPTPWMPSDLSANLLLWLDAEDQDTIVQVSGKISQWSDKSGFGRHVTQNSAALRPTYSSSTYGSCISYDGNNQLEIPAAAIGAISPETFVIVGLCNGGTPGVANRYIIYNGRVSSTTGVGQHVMFNSNDKLYMYDAYDSNTAKYVDSQAVNVSQDSIFSFYHDGTNLIKRQYGTQFDSDVTSGTYNVAIAILNLIGRPPLDGVIYSFIVAKYTSDLDVQKLEGYICHRYGAQALLDSSHPYRNEAP